ncbi:MAG TPA: bifunctional methylenetetrahydrofolate dehydrogenase/methenyltetrahydrofolate cyclohydrolase FolD [Thermovirgaceae bacterium]|jgi:methylenetetrahydrofolate dehydrogenase (NADP+)/methenyltetrahydrofolate cyclohydrolase|nr:bifunctional methylenetetrahydrofolate dehydrogenase/methenyltetrahydrofolate cyclohydrolase FolD [Thermovirgaceae bacterium]
MSTDREKNIARILDGKAVAASVRNDIKNRVRELEKIGKTPPGLAVVLVGDDPASKVYVGQKEKACLEVGFRSFLHRLPASASGGDVLSLVDSLNRDAKVHGILVQLPLPGQIDETFVLEAIDPSKDVDGFHPANMGRLVMGLPSVEPCTPRGIMHLLSEYRIETSGKKAVVLGRSNIVGKPVAHMLMAADATVTVCHSRTPELETYTREADIIVAAIGRPSFLKPHMVKEGCVVVDVGINRLENGLVGDVDFKGISEKASWITPVPGGVGPMTIAMLMLNTFERYLQN